MVLARSTADAVETTAHVDDRPQQGLLEDFARKARAFPSRRGTIIRLMEFCTMLLSACSSHPEGAPMESKRARRVRLAGRAGAAAAVAMMLLAFGIVTSGAAGGAPQDGGRSPRDADEKDRGKGGPARKDAPPEAKVKLGLSINDPKAARGYTLLNPSNSKKVYLIDLEGRVIQTWESEHQSMHPAYLLNDGHVLRVAALAGADRAFGGGGGSAGRIQEFDWDGKLIWDYQMSNAKQFQHHDALKLPSGNVLLVVWEKKTRAEAIAAGRKPEAVSEYVLPDSILEVKPTGKTTADVVWEWHLWDHLVQDHDATKANYGDVASHPELVDINFITHPMDPGPGPRGPNAKGAPPGPDAAKKNAANKAEAEKLKTLGYVGTPRQQSQRVNPDWTHVNSVDYNAELDQILVSVHELSEIWIIDHSTTKAEAAGHTGGRSGKGGDLLYRWGNPLAYRAGTKADQTLFVQHNAQWIPRGLPGEGHVLVFNNGGHRPDGSYSSVDEIVVPVDRQGKYKLEPGAAYGPKKAVWSYSAPNKEDFYASFISGAHRLKNGNTFICNGPNGTIFEVTPDKQIVWKYVNPVKGGFGPFGGPQPNQVLPRFLQDTLALSGEQRKEIGALQKNVDEALSRILTDPQKRTLRERSNFGPGGPTGMPAPGQVMSVSTQVTLRPTSEQKTQLSDLQKTVDTTLEKVLTDDQKKQLTQARADFARGGPGGPGGGGPGGPPRGPGGPGGPRGGPPGGSGLFRAYKYAPEYPGLADKVLKPGKSVEELQPKEPEKAGGAPKAKETATR
jgi:hypothetical protein